MSEINIDFVTETEYLCFVFVVGHPRCPNLSRPQLPQPREHGGHRLPTSQKHGVRLSLAITAVFIGILIA